MPPPTITVTELWAMRSKKRYNRKATFEQILARVHKRMRMVAEHNALNCFYEVPNMIFGMPLFDIAECVEFIVGSLRASGFFVQTVPSHIGIIYISWSPADIRPRKALRTDQPYNNNSSMVGNGPLDNRYDRNFSFNN